MPFINVSPFHEFLSGMNFILQINVGVVKLTGASGTGKTALLQELERNTTQAQQDIVAFYSTPSSFQQIKDAIRQRLKLDPATNFHDAVLNHLLGKPYAQRRLTVVFDNAEFLDDATLLAVGHLRSIQHAGQHLIGIVLCGRPELNRIIRQPEHRVLAQDVLLSYELSPLSSQQLPDFCRACLAARGLDSYVLTADDYRQIMQKSDGLPGNVAELVETYWPEDPEISAPSAYTPAPVKEQEIVFEPQTTAALENPTTVADPLFYARSVRTDVAPDVTPVISPEMSFELSTDSSFDIAAESVSIDQIASDAATDAATAKFADTAFGDSSESRLDFASGFTPEASYDSFADIADTTSQQVLSEDFGAEAGADTISSVPHQDSEGAITGNSLPAEFTTASDTLSDGACEVSPEPLPEVSFDFSADTPAGIASGLASDAATAEPSEAPEMPQQIPQIATPVPVAPVARSQLRFVVGFLLAASVVIVLIQILNRDSHKDAAATAVIATSVPAPATLPQTAEDNTVTAVNVQQFGEPPVARPSVNSAEVVPQPIKTPPAQAANIKPAPAPVISAVTAAPVAVPATPVSPQAIATAAKGVVNSWIDAWQSLDVDAYLAFYHADFVPPNQASRAEWESSRRSIITSQNSISIELADFEVLGSADDQTQVQFMLTYRGDTYADRTLKELVLQPDASGELRIVQEHNLRTEAFDPVIEAASSWMPDTATAGANESSTENEPAFQQTTVGSSRVDLQACKLEYSIVSPK